MRIASVVVLVAACGSAAPRPPANRVQETTPPSSGKRVWIQQQLTLGDKHASAQRSRWVLTVQGTRATMDVVFERADGVTTLERAREHVAWTQTETRTLEGPVRDLRDHVAFDLAAPDESLFLKCWKRPIVVGRPGARRIHRPGHDKDCADPGTWDTEMLKVEAMLCGFGEALDDGQEDGIDGQNGPLDETLFRFVADPGIEHVQIRDACLESSGLRLVER